MISFKRAAEGEGRERKREKRDLVAISLPFPLRRWVLLSKPSFSGDISLLSSFLPLLRLLEIFQEDKVLKNLAQRLRSDSIRPLLERFLAILEVGIGDAGGSRPGFESWTRSQIEAVVSVARLIVLALRSTSGMELFLFFSQNL